MAKKKVTNFGLKYYNLKNSTSYTGKKTFLSNIDPRQKKAAERWLDTQQAYQMHKPVAKKFKRLKIITQFQQQLQGDLVDVSSLAEHNSGTKYLLTVIDAFSRKAFVEPVLNKSAKSVAIAFESILKRVGFQPMYFYSDQGSEFVNAVFKKVLKKHNIVSFTSLDKDIKASIVERFNRTLMMRIHRYLTKQNSYSYVDALPDLIRNYNNTVHSATGYAPVKINHFNKEKVWLRLYHKCEHKKRDLPYKKTKLKKRICSGGYGLDT